jgi:hypothetical protein
MLTGATSSTIASTLTNVRSPMRMFPYQERGAHDNVAQHLAQEGVPLVPRARRGAVEPREQLLHVPELGRVLGVVGDVQLTSEHPLPHLTHAAPIPDRTMSAAYAVRHHGEPRFP